MTLAPDTIYLLCLRLDACTCSQSSKSSSRHSGFARKRLVQSVIFFCVDAAFWLIQTATSASFAPVAMNSRKLPHPARRQQRTCDPPDSCSGTHRSRRRVLRGIYPPGARPRLESWRAQSAGFGELFGSDRAQAHEVFLRSQLRSNLQLLRKPRQNFATCFGDQNHVFQPYAAQSRIVQAGLNGHHLPIF